MCKEDAKCKSKGRFGTGIGVCLDTGKKCRLSTVSVALDSAPSVTKWFASALLREETTANIYIYIYIDYIVYI